MDRNNLPLVNEQENVSSYPPPPLFNNSVLNTESNWTFAMEVEDTVLDEEANVYTFGQNSYGELAHGDTQERFIPTVVDLCKGKEVIDIACGNEHTAVLCDNGEVYTCGYNDSGQCGIGTTHRVTSLKHIKELNDKSVVRLASANGCEHLAAITNMGDLYTCGYNARGQLGHGQTAPLASPTLVNALIGKVITKAACSYFHTVVVTDDDEVYACGRNDYGQCGFDDGMDKHIPHRIDALRGRPVIAVACGQYHTVVSLTSGGIFSFGKNDYGQLGVETPDARSTPVLVSSPLNDKIVTQLACGYYHTVALTNEGKIYSFGRNDYGQLGLGHKQNTWKPTLVIYLQDKNIFQIACGCYHTLALSSDGKCYSWGRNNHGQLGTNNTIDSPIPQLVESLRGKRVRRVAAGFYHSVCLTGRIRHEGLELLETNSLSLDLSKMINNPARSDVTFVINGMRLYAHRCIIMARCEPLEKMLNGPMRESHEDEIVIPDHSFSVFLALMEFIYTDLVLGLNKPDVDVEFALDLLSLADQFLIPKLKCKCEYAIQKSINIKNVSVMLKAADARNALGLRKRCIDFILSNFGSVIGTTSFSELPQELLQQILFAASKRGVSVSNNNI